MEDGPLGEVCWGGVGTVRIQALWKGGSNIGTRAKCAKNYDYTHFLLQPRPFVLGFVIDQSINLFLIKNSAKYKESQSKNLLSVLVREGSSK